VSSEGENFAIRRKIGRSSLKANLYFTILAGNKDWVIDALGRTMEEDDLTTLRPLSPPVRAPRKEKESSRKMLDLSLGDRRDKEKASHRLFAKESTLLMEKGEEFFRFSFFYLGPNQSR